MKASKLRQRITLITVTTTQSPTGGSPKTTYTEGPTIWANIEPLSTRDVIQAKAAGSQAALRCIIRYRKDINTTMRIRYDGKTYKIDGEPLADKDSGREYLTLLLVSV